MENFKYPPEPLRIRVTEPTKRITRAYREEAIIESSMNPFLPDSENALIDLLTDSGTEAVTQSMQAVMIRGSEAYSGSRSYYVSAESVKDIFGYQYITPTHRSRGAKQIYIPVLIKRREQEKDLDHSKTVAFSNYFFDTTQGHSQIDGCIVCNVYIKEALDTDVCYDFKGSFDLEGLERGIREVSPNNVSYIIAVITSNSAGGQPASLANLKAAYNIVKRYDIPVVIDSTRLAKNAHFIKQREVEYRDWTIEQITRETYRYADTLAMPARKDAMVPMGGLLYMKDGSFFSVYTECRIPCAVQESFSTYGGLKGGATECLAIGLYDDVDLDWLAYRIAQVQYLVDDLEEIGIACQQADDHTVFVGAGKLLPHIPAGQFPAQALACELYEVAGIYAVGIGSFLLGRDLKADKQPPCPAELLCLTAPRVTYTQTHMDFIIEVLKHVRGSAANIKGLTFTYEPKVLRHSTAKLRKV